MHQHISICWPLGTVRRLRWATYPSGPLFLVSYANRSVGNIHSNFLFEWQCVFAAGWFSANIPLVL